MRYRHTILELKEKCAECGHSRFAHTREKGKCLCHNNSFLQGGRFDACSCEQFTE